MNLRTAFLWLLIGSLTVAAAMGIAVLLLPQFFGMQDEVLGSAALISGFSLIGFICAIGLDRKRLVPIMWAGVIASIIAASVWLIVIWTGWTIWGPRGFTYELAARIGWTATTIAVWAALTGMLLLRSMQRRIAQRILQGGAILTAVVAILSIGGIWLEPDDWFWLGVFGSYAAMLVWTLWFTLIVRMRVTRSVSRVVQGLTCFAGSAATLWLVMLSWDISLANDDLVGRFAGVMFILTAAGSIIVMILPRLDRTADAKERESLPNRLGMEIVCPRCKHRQELPGGHSRCRECGLRFLIEIEEPRCACGYLLHMLQGDSCPECGRVIPLTDRWAMRVISHETHDANAAGASSASA